MNKNKMMEISFNSKIQEILSVSNIAICNSLKLCNCKYCHDGDASWTICITCNYFDFGRKCYNLHGVGGVSICEVCVTLITETQNLLKYSYITKILIISNITESHEIYDIKFIIWKIFVQLLMMDGNVLLNNFKQLFICRTPSAGTTGVQIQL